MGHWLLSPAASLYTASPSPVMAAGGFQRCCVFCCSSPNPPQKRQLVRTVCMAAGGRSAVCAAPGELVFPSTITLHWAPEGPMSSPMCSAQPPDSPAAFFGMVGARLAPAKKKTNVSWHWCNQNPNVAEGSLSPNVPISAASISSTNPPCQEGCGVVVKNSAHRDGISSDSLGMKHMLWALEHKVVSSL